jgi:hypothetical protein
MKFKSVTGSDVQINLLSGHSGTVFANEWTELHPMFHREALALGCVTDNMSAEAIAASELPSPEAAAQASLVRTSKIRDAIEAMILDGDKADFTQSGMPSLTKLGKRAGFGVERTEMEAIWKQIEADNDVVPSGE